MASNTTAATTAAHPMPCRDYRGRIAPTPTGLLHMGHARTFRIAWERSRSAGGTVVYRQEDLDPQRCTDAFAQAAIEDLRRYGLNWDEGPDCTPPGAHAPYCQSQRTGLYRAALLQLIRSGHAYPDGHSRGDLSHALDSGLSRPTPILFGEQDSEAIFPPQWRPTDAEWFANPQARQSAACAIEQYVTASAPPSPPAQQATGQASAAQSTQNDPPATQPNSADHSGSSANLAHQPDRLPRKRTDQPSNPADLLGKSSVTWRFRVPDGESLCFTDGCFGKQRFTAGEDFGDFTLWRRDGIPAYELAVVVDDIAMAITEVVRGADLLRSTARQLLIYRALGATPPSFYHCPLVLDPQTGQRLAKRADSLSLRSQLDLGHVCKPTNE